MIWYIIWGVILLGGAFIGGVLFERKNASKVQAVATAAENVQKQL